ncbi:MAG: CDP-glycerol glycerophosphotransferase family protein [Clostridia bacterium]|nr:CDP-glycerol glycerophosphotransferase family protein [Clostridia bacterium]
MKKTLIDLFNKLCRKIPGKRFLKTMFDNFQFFFLWRLVFNLYKLKKIDEKLLLFVADSDTEVPVEYKSLFQKAEKEGYKCVCIFKFKSGNSVTAKNIINKFKSDLKFQKYFAVAKTTFLREYYLPAYANKPRKNTNLVQLWHGCGAFKKFSYSTKDTDWGLESALFEKYRVHKNYTHILVSSEHIIEQYSEAFSADEKNIYPWGVPRTDVYFDHNFVKKQKDILIERFPTLSGRKIILWAPTFRGNNLDKSYNDKAIDFIKLCSAISDDTAFLIKLHPRAAKGLVFSAEEQEAMKNKVFNISNDVSIETALCSADIVITDYSSLIFEYALLSRPMIFFAYDLEKYNCERSFYFDYESFIPGKIAKNTDELIDCIFNAEKDFNKEKNDAFLKKFMSACDGKSTERIFERLIKN